MAEASTNFNCNLLPAVTGDVDLGATDGAPLPNRAVGSSFEVPLRVNTGGLYLGTFDIFVHYDPTMLAIDDPKAAVTFNRNTHQISSGILDAVASAGEQSAHKERGLQCGR